MSRPAPNHRSESRDVQEPPPYPEHQDQQRGASDSGNITVDPEGITALAAQSRNRNRHKRFAYNALAAVARGRLPIAGWDGHDYKYLAVLAHALEDDSLPLDALICDPAAGWSRQRAFATRAMIAHVASEWQRSNDEDVECDVGNDNVYLAELFRLNRENPFVAAMSLEQLDRC